MKNILISLFLCLLYHTTTAQDTSTQQLFFNFMGLKEGLPEGTVNALLQDKHGYIWIGTQNGLVRFDGYLPKVYSLNSSNGGITDIITIYEDSKSRLWIGTYPNGLYYYDRSADKFVNYKLSTQKEGKADDYAVIQIQEDRKSNLWMIVKNLQKSVTGLMSFNTQSKQCFSYSNIDKGNHHINCHTFYDLYKDYEGTIWAGTDNGFYNYGESSDKFTGFFTSADSSSQRGVSNFAQDSLHPNLLWATGWTTKGLKNEGLWQYDIRQHTLKKFLHDAANTHSIANDEIFTIENFQKGSLCLGTDTGVSFFNTSTEQFENYIPKDARKKSYDNYIKKIIKDGNGNLWCQSLFGLLFFNNATKTFTRYTTFNKKADGLQSNTIRSLMLARDGILWLGAEQTGLQWLNTDRSRFVLYANKPGDPHYFPGGSTDEFAEAKDGSIWLTCSEGLYQWIPVKNTFIKIDLDTHAENNVDANAVTIDKDGLVWCRFYGDGGVASGIYSYDPKTKKVTNYRHNDNDSTSLVNDNVRVMCVDDTGLLWIGTFGNGICSFNKHTGKFTRYKYILNTGFNEPSELTNGALDDDQVQSVYKDRDGNIWVGTNNGNLNKFDRRTNTFGFFKKYLPGFSTIMSIYVDGDHNVWAGSYMSGLFRFNENKKSYARLSQADGLLYDGCWGINQDDNGNIWIASARGLSILNPKTNQLRNISAANGLPGEIAAFNIFRTTSGHLLIGTKDGFIEWNPADFSLEKTTAPMTHIESVTFPAWRSGRVYDSSIITFDKNELQLRYDENRITFHYVGLQYQSPALTQYFYRLDGYDKDWVKAGTQRQVTYTNLSPGTYTFYVKAMNSDGIWSDKEDMITVTIAPPWWKTWWAYILYFIVCIVGVSAVIAYRSARLEKENRILEEKVEERTHQLNESLAELKATQSQLVQSEKMASLGELTAGIAHEIQNPLNFVNNFSELNTELIQELKQEIDNGNVEEAKLIAGDIELNEQKINQHGKRADAIIKGMMQHSRKSTGQKEATDINALADEYLRLSYHGLRAKDQSFNATIHTDFDTNAGKVKLVPQDIGRVLLNLLNNAFYAVDEKKKSAGTSYQPIVSLITKKLPSVIQVIVKDNGNGVPPEIAEKIYQPFFTTKPTGKGTGLGLSLSYDIITKEHQGKIELETKPGEGASFIISLPV